MRKFFRRIGKAIGKTVGGVAQIAVGIVTLDRERISKGFTDVLDGATFGGYSKFMGWWADTFWQQPERVYQEMAARKVTTTGSQTPIGTIYGTAVTGGNMVWYGGTGDLSEYFIAVYALADYQIAGVRSIWVNDDLVFANVPDGNQTLAASAQGDYKDRITAYVRTGQSGVNTVSDPRARAAGWTTGHRMDGNAYVLIVFKLNPNDDKSQELYRGGMPRVRFEVRGKLINGAWTDNQAAIIRDYLLTPVEQGGFGATTAELDEPSFTAGIALCDQQVPKAGGGTEKRYTANGVVSSAQLPIDNLQQLCAAGACFVDYVQGKYVYIQGAYQAPPSSEEFNERDLIGGVSFDLGAGKADLVNTVRGSFVDPANNYDAVDYPEIQAANGVALDGEVLPRELNWPLTTSAGTARRLAKIALLQSRGRTLSLTMTTRIYTKRVGDRIQLSIHYLGWNKKVFRIVGLNLGIGRGAQVDLVEDGPDVWAWSAREAIAVPIAPALNLPDLGDLPAPTGLTIQEQINTPNTALGDRSTLQLSATPPAVPAFQYLQFEYRLQGDNNWTTIGYENNQQASVVVQSFGGTFDFRARAVDSAGNVSRFAATASHTVFDVRSQKAQDKKLLLPKIAGLHLVNSTKTEHTEFVSGAAEFEWQPRSQTNSTEFGNDVFGADDGVLDPFFDGYQINLYRTSGERLTPVYSEQTNDNGFTVTLDLNKRFSLGRRFGFGVVAKGVNGQLGEEQRFIVQNRAPAIPSVGFQVGFSTISMALQQPTDEDFVGFDLFFTSGGQDPYKATPIRISGNSYTVDGLVPGFDYAVGVRSIDEFGIGEQSPVLPVSTKKIESSALGNITTPVTIDEQGGRLITNNSGYIAFHGATSAPSESQFPLIFGAFDGDQYPFWVDAAGNVKITGKFSAGGQEFGVQGIQLEPQGSNARAFIGNAASGQFLRFEDGVLELGPNSKLKRTQTSNVSVTVGTGGDFPNLVAALEAFGEIPQGFNNSGVTATIWLLQGTTNTTGPVRFKNGLNLAHVRVRSNTNVIDFGSSTIDVEDGAFAPVFNAPVLRTNSPLPFITVQNNSTFQFYGSQIANHGSNAALLRLSGGSTFVHHVSQHNGTDCGLFSNTPSSFPSILAADGSVIRITSQFANNLQYTLSNVASGPSNYPLELRSSTMFFDVDSINLELFINTRRAVNVLDGSKVVINTMRVCNIATTFVTPLFQVFNSELMIQATGRQDGGQMPQAVTSNFDGAYFCLLSRSRLTVGVGPLEVSGSSANNLQLEKGSIVSIDGLVTTTANIAFNTLTGSGIIFR